MIKIISPAQYKTIPWKNGLGETTELAISEGGNLSNFDWRLSIASVSEDGMFSDFSGYSRHLVLISGNGLTLQHQDDSGDKQVDELSKVLDISIFDGGCSTLGMLTSGPIKDFNIMTKTGKYKAKVDTYIDQQTVSLSTEQVYFVYCLDKDALFHTHNVGEAESDHNNLVKIENQRLPAKCLMKVSQGNKKQICLMGKNMIVIGLSEV